MRCQPLKLLIKEAFKQLRRGSINSVVDHVPSIKTESYPVQCYGLFKHLELKQ